VSARTRIRLIVGGLALIAAAVVAGVALIGRGDSSPERKAPVLELSVILGDDAEAQALRVAERNYDSGRTEEARSQFAAVLRDDPDSVEAAVGAAIASWPDGTLERLRELESSHPESALVHLHLGLALYAEGRQDEAAGEWRKAVEVEPDSQSAVRAGDLLHPDMAPGLPSFFTALRPPKGLAGKSAQEQLDALEHAARDGGDADDWILYGTALQRVGKPLSARAAFDRALELAPDRLDAKVAAAVGRFDKGDPSARSRGSARWRAPTQTPLSSISTSACCFCGSETFRTRAFSSRKPPLPGPKVSTAGKQNRSFPVLKPLGPNI